MKTLIRMLAGLAMSCGLVAGVTAQSITPRSDVDTWAVSGGEVGVRWNRDLANDLHIQIGSASAVLPGLDQRQHERFVIRSAGSLEFRVDNGHLRGFANGSLQANGGYRLTLPDGVIDLTHFRLQPDVANPLRLNLLAADGRVWFYVDKLMYEMADEGRSFAVRTADLRITRELAERLNQPLAAGMAIADVALTSDVLRGGLAAAPEGSCNTNNGANCNWAGTAAPSGGTYQADLFMESFSPEYSRCESCSGPSGSGKVVFTPSSSLKNNVNAGSIQTTVGGQGDAGKSTALWAADVPWFEKFSGPNQPYNNDQHPFLIWNMYRIGADGSLTQIARSGVKHAFVTINAGADCPYPFSHVLGRSCEDTYATGNNDSSTDLGPRSEIIPATNQWGRCGSIYDVNCTGTYHDPGNDSYDQRLVVNESQLSLTRNPGSTFLFESWYLARQDINIYNSMGTVNVSQNWTGSFWSMNPTNYKLGPAIDRWVDPVNPPANAKNTELATSEGHVKVAVKVTALPNGKWRYNYAVMNLDFSRAVTTGAEPNLRVTSNKGFDSFSVPTGGAAIASSSSNVGEVNPNLNWRSRNASGRLTWSTDLSGTGFGSGAFPQPTALTTLDWGVLYAFTLVANAPPVAGSATLHVAQSGSPASFDVATLVPGAAAVARN